eukprot:6214427-Pleurochrysis_carterae.AAC.1
MPSGLWKGPENNKSTVREESAGLVASGVCVGNSDGFGLSEVRTGALGSPGGWSLPVSWAAVAIGVCVVVEEGFQGKMFSSK